MRALKRDHFFCVETKTPKITPELTGCRTHPKINRWQKLLIHSRDVFLCFLFLKLMEIWVFKVGCFKIILVVITSKHGEFSSRTSHWILGSLYCFHFTDKNVLIPLCWWLIIESSYVEVRDFYCGIYKIQWIKIYPKNNQQRVYFILNLIANGSLQVVNVK